LLYQLSYTHHHLAVWVIGVEPTTDALRPAVAAAERLFRRVLETHPPSAYCLKGLGYCLFQQGRHDEAIDTYRRAIAADPKYEPAHSLRQGTGRIPG
jgi:tetratricopeptide (TPR) repeat protein